MANIKFSKLRDLFNYNTYVKKKLRNARILAPAADLEALDNYDSSILKVNQEVITAYLKNIQSIGQMNRLARYSDYTEMETYAEIGSALDIYTDECMTPNEDGDFFIIESKNQRIKGILDELFFDILNFKINLRVWLRTLQKYGDLYLFLNISNKGILDAFPLPVSDVERVEEMEDGRFKVTFRWLSSNTMLENFQVVNFRLLSKEIYFPYGTSVIENARRVWRQLTLMEDMMLSYRMIRSSERRVFYIDVGNIPADKVTSFINKLKASLKQNKITDPTTGKNDLRYDPYDVEQDYYIPVRGNKSGTRIDTLPAGANVTAIDDVNFLKDKLFAALKIPKSYLGYEADINSKNTLIQEDIRFARTIAAIQKQFIADCNKIAMVHLYLNGIPEEDITNFELSLPLSSTAYELQKLHLWQERVNIISSLSQYPVEWVLKEVLNISEKKYKKYLEYQKKQKEQGGGNEEQGAGVLPVPGGGEQQESTGKEEKTESEHINKDEDINITDDYIKNYDYSSIFNKHNKNENIISDGLNLDPENIKRFLAEYQTNKPEIAKKIDTITQVKIGKLYESKREIKRQLIENLSRIKTDNKGILNEN